MCVCVGDREEGRKGKRRRECILTAWCEAVIVTCLLSEDDSVSQSGRAEPAGDVYVPLPSAGQGEAQRWGESKPESILSSFHQGSLCAPQLLSRMLTTLPLTLAIALLAGGTGSRVREGLGQSLQDPCLSLSFVCCALSLSLTGSCPGLLRLELIRLTSV